MAAHDASVLRQRRGRAHHRYLERRAVREERTWPHRDSCGEELGNLGGRSGKKDEVGALQRSFERLGRLDAALAGSAAGARIGVEARAH